MNLQMIRKQKGISQTRLAQLSGVHRVSIVRYEEGRTTPNARNALKLARALGCTIDDLLGEKKDHDGLTESPNEGDAQNG